MLTNSVEISPFMKDPQTPKKVAVLVSSSTGWGRRLISGILAYSNSVGPWRLSIMDLPIQEFAKRLDHWKCHGIIARVSSPEIAKELQRHNVPIVNVADSPVAGFRAPSIRTDDRIASRMAINHFLERGLRNIAFVGPTNYNNPVQYKKVFGEELNAVGLPLSNYEIEPDERYDSEKLSKWLNDLTKPVGILSWGYGYARVILEHCLDSGLPVPHDVAVLSADYDELLSRVSFPELSGIVTPTEQIGLQAAKTLELLMNGFPAPAGTTYIAPRKIVEHLSTDTIAIRDPKLNKVIEYVQEHAFETISMEEILKVVPIARRSLEQRFQQAFGRSIFDEIRRIRINKARTLLVDTDLPMQNIAEACGYATYNYLSQIFKKTTGSNLRDYRKKHRSPK